MSGRDEADSSPEAGGPTRRETLGMGAGLVALYLVVQLVGHTHIGLTDDDDFYVPAGIKYVEWLGRAVTFQDGAWNRRAMDAAFTTNHEHPPIAKYALGLCEAVFGGWLGPTDGARVATVLFSTLTAALLLVLAVTHLGRRRGLFAGGVGVLLLLTLPRFYFHSHAGTLDVPVAAMYVATATLALLAERSVKAAIWTGVVFGLASATKLNAPFLIVPYLIFALVVRRKRGRHAASAQGRWWSLPPMPLAFFTMVVIGPLVFFLSWPWMWFEPFKRVPEYVAFHLNHYGIYFLYFGTVFDKSTFAPWHAPFTMAAITVPVATSVLAVLGIAFGRDLIWSRIARPQAYDTAIQKEGDLLFSSVLHAGFSILIVAFSGGPKYGGAKLFMPFFPFWCLLAGYGGLRLYEALHDAYKKKWVPVGILASAVAASMALQLKFGAYALSEYNGLVGGLRGATATGFERQYYDIAFRDLVAWLSKNAPPSTKVHFLPNNWEYVRTYKWYKRASELRADITVVQSPNQAQWLILTHERRFSRYGSDLLAYRGRKILKEKRVDGVPIWTVVKLR